MPRTPTFILNWENNTTKVCFIYWFMGNFKVSQWLSVEQTHGTFMNHMGLELQTCEDLDPYNHVCVRQLPLLMKIIIIIKKGRKKAYKKVSLPPCSSIKWVCSVFQVIGLKLVLPSSEAGSISHSPLERSNPFEEKIQKHAEFHLPKKSWS